MTTTGEKIKGIWSKLSLNTDSECRTCMAVDLTVTAHSLYLELYYVTSDLTVNLIDSGVYDLVVT